MDSENSDIFTNMTPRKRHNISHITRMELNESEINRFEKFELPDLSRRSERKRIKIPQSTGKKKLPGWFSIPDDEESTSKQTNHNNGHNNTLDVSVRKRIQSEQVSPRNQEKPTHKNSKSISTNNKITSAGKSKK